MPSKDIATYELARERYAEVGVDAEQALTLLASVPISLPCWQGDDVTGFESGSGGEAGGGIQATGAYPGRARNADELRADLALALKLIPGPKRVNLHAMYGDFGPRAPDRDAIGVQHFTGWLEWAADQGVALDFNATLFRHRLAAGGFTLASKIPAVRQFWIEHVRRCREIAAAIGQRQKTACIHNLWIPDGSKDECVDRGGHRAILKQSLDEIYQTTFDRQWLIDAVESKLFGIGSEAFVVGSHEFYFGYALTRNLVPCLDLGHFHPTESIADKLSAMLLYFDRLLLHISRGIRWDSDHVPVFEDSLRAVAQEMVRAQALGRVHLALDCFDASINRIAAWVLGARAVQKALLFALLEPWSRLLELEEQSDYTGRLALLEAAKGMPWAVVWETHCQRHDVPDDLHWLEAVREYESAVLATR